MKDDIVNTLIKYGSTNNIDYAAYKQSIYFINDLSGLIFGLVFWFLFSLFGLRLLLDLIYLTMPPFRELIARYGLGYSEDKRFNAISPQAYHALLEADTVSTGKSALLIYIGNSIKVLVITTLITLVALMYYDDLVIYVGKLAVEVYIVFKDTALSGIK